MKLSDNNIFPGLWEFLTNHISAERRSKFEEVVANRTRFITVVLENVYQSQNASAVLRTSECFGIQDIHIIENGNEYNVNPDVVRGADNWLNIRNWNQQEHNTSDCLKYLKKKGYCIAATTLHDDSIPLHDFFPERKTAMVFGNEMHGISNIVNEQSDVFVKIPMVGFTESYNLSVSAAIILSHLSKWMRSAHIQWQLTKKEQNELLLHWISNHLKNSRLMIERYVNDLTGKDY